MITDHQFCQFLDQLGVSVRGKNGLILTDWENQFLGTYLGLPNGSFHFTEARRAAVDRMWRRYGPELDFPHPLDTVSARVIPPAAADACQYLVRLDGLQQCCNDPAEWVNRRGFRYCATHADQVRKDLKRRGEVMVMVPFTTKV